jgi:hypothetical protein
MIQCNEITQSINELLIAFQDCNKVKNSDLRKLVELVAAVNTCSNGGPLYNTEVNELYEPLLDTIVTYPINTYHSISIMILEGTITETIGVTVVTYPTKTVLNTEFTTLNQTPTIFTVKAGSKVVVKYLIETP